MFVYRCLGYCKFLGMGGSIKGRLRIDFPVKSWVFAQLSAMSDVDPEKLVSHDTINVSPSATVKLVEPGTG